MGGVGVSEVLWHPFSLSLWRPSTGVRGVFRVVGIFLVATVTSKVMLPFCAIGPSTFKAPSPKFILSMSINVAKL